MGTRNRLGNLVAPAVLLDPPEAHGGRDALSDGLPDLLGREVHLQGVVEGKRRENPLTSFASARYGHSALRMAWTYSMRRSSIASRRAFISWVLLSIALASVSMESAKWSE